MKIEVKTWLKNICIELNGDYGGHNITSPITLYFSEFHWIILILFFVVTLLSVQHYF